MALANNVFPVPGYFAPKGLKTLRFFQKLNDFFHFKLGFIAASHIGKFDHGVFGRGFLGRIIAHAKHSATALTAHGVKKHAHDQKNGAKRQQQAE